MMKKMAIKIKSSSMYSADKKDLMKEISQEKLVRFNAMVPISLHNKLKVYVAKKGSGTSMTSLVVTILDDFLSKNSNE